MKKLAFLLAFVLVISMPIHAFATPRATIASPTLSFSGTTATCKVTIVGNNTSEYIQATMKLMHGTTCIAAWSASGNGYVTMSKTATVTVGETYVLIVESYINGIQQTPKSVTGTC